MATAIIIGAATVSMEVLAFWVDPEAMLVLVGGAMLGSVKLVNKVFLIAKSMNLLVEPPLEPVPVRWGGELDWGELVWGELAWGELAWGELAWGGELDCAGELGCTAGPLWGGALPWGGMLLAGGAIGPAGALCWGGISLLEGELGWAGALGCEGMVFSGGELFWGGTSVADDGGPEEAKGEEGISAGGELAPIELAATGEDIGIEAPSVAGDDGTSGGAADDMSFDIGGAAGDEAADVGGCIAVISHVGHTVWVSKTGTVTVACVFIGAEGETASAVLTDGTLMLTEGVPADVTLATPVAWDLVTTLELSTNTSAVDVTVRVLVWWPFDTSTVVMNTLLEVLSCAEGTLFGTDGTLLGGIALLEADAGPAGDVSWTTLVFEGAGTDTKTLEYGPKLVEVMGTKVTVLPPMQEAQLAVTTCTWVATTVVNVYVCEVMSVFWQVFEELGQPTVTMELTMEVTVVQGRSGGIEAVG
jgi:hypothetical protein